jgi:hypothetical protein
MPSEESRQLLKAFGIAVTELEDAVQKSATKEELARADAEVSARFEQVKQLIERLRARAKSK